MVAPDKPGHRSHHVHRLCGRHGRVRNGECVERRSQSGRKRVKVRGLNLRVPTRVTPTDRPVPRAARQKFLGRSRPTDQPTDGAYLLTYSNTGWSHVLKKIQKNLVRHRSVGRSVGQIYEGFQNPVFYWLVCRLTMHFFLNIFLK